MGDIKRRRVTDDIYTEEQVVESQISAPRTEDISRLVGIDKKLTPEGGRLLSSLSGVPNDVPLHPSRTSPNTNDPVAKARIAALSKTKEGQEILREEAKATQREAFGARTSVTRGASGYTKGPAQVRGGQQNSSYANAPKEMVGFVLPTTTLPDTVFIKGINDEEFNYMMGDELELCKLINCQHTCLLQNQAGENSSLESNNLYTLGGQKRWCMGEACPKKNISFTPSEKVSFNMLVSNGMSEHDSLKAIIISRMMESSDPPYPKEVLEELSKNPTRVEQRPQQKNQRALPVNGIIEVDDASDINNLDNLEGPSAFEKNW